MAADRPTIVVTAAVVRRGRDSEYLVTRRLRGVHLENLWEFPGGKCEPGETHEDCLRREIDEELGVGLQVGPKILKVSHDYADRTVELHFFDCTLLGDPTPLLGQEMRWVAPGELRLLEFPPADAELIAILQDQGPGTRGRGPGGQGLGASARSNGQGRSAGSRSPAVKNGET